MGIIIIPYSLMYFDLAPAHLTSLHPALSPPPPILPPSPHFHFSTLLINVFLRQSSINKRLFTEFYQREDGVILFFCRPLQSEDEEDDYDEEEV